MVYWVHLLLGAVIIITSGYSIKVSRFPAFNRPFFFAVAAGIITFTHAVYMVFFNPSEHTLIEALILTAIFVLLVACFTSFAMRIKRIIV
jgi:hypothetical protein